MRSVNIPIIKSNGRMKVLNPTLFERVIASLKQEEVYRLRIEKKERTDSEGSRKYFFGVVMKMIAEETGHSTEALHDHFKRKLLGTKIDKNGIVTVSSVFSDESTMTVKEKWEYIDEIRRWSADFLNLYIPSPESVAD